MHFYLFKVQGQAAGRRRHVVSVDHTPRSPQAVSIGRSPGDAQGPLQLWGPPCCSPCCLDLSHQLPEGTAQVYTRHLTQGPIPRLCASDLPSFIAGGMTGCISHPSVWIGVK